MIKKILYLIILFIFFAIAVFLISRLKVRKINCISQFGQCSIDIQNKLSYQVGKNLLNSRKDIPNLLKKDIFIKEFEIRYSPPGTYNVYVIERKKTIAFLYGDKYLTLDEENNVLTETSSTTLPTIEVTSSGVSYSKLSFAAQIYSQVSFKYQINKATISNEGLQLEIDNKQIIFPLNGDLDLILGSLELTLSWLKHETNFTKIDLRYSNPVLK